MMTNRTNKLIAVLMCLALWSGTAWAQPPNERNDFRPPSVDPHLEALGFCRAATVVFMRGELRQPGGLGLKIWHHGWGLVKLLPPTGKGTSLRSQFLPMRRALIWPNTEKRLG